MFGGNYAEVKAAFRGHHVKAVKRRTTSSVGENGTLRDGLFGSIEEDAQRRDFTINSLYTAQRGGFTDARLRRRDAGLCKKA